MADYTEEITVKPEIALLEQVLGDIAAGRLRVPKFQRPFVWRPEQMLGLFDSIERGYPIGSLLVWDTKLTLPSLDHVAGIPIPQPPHDGTVSYLLDGHQRLSTLFGTLIKRPQADATELNQWRWQVYRALGHHEERSSKFRHWKQPHPPVEYLPMQAVLRTMDFLAYARTLTGAHGSDDPGIADLIDEAEQLAQRIKSYKIAVVRLVGGDLSHAVEVFSRLNSSGQQMTPDQMVSALTYRADAADSLADRIERIQEDLGDLGFGQIPSTTIFRSILAVTGEEDVQRTQWDVLAKRVQGKLDNAVGETESALHLTVRFLKSDIGVPLARLVPYGTQIILLVAFFNIVPEPSESQRQAVSRWFWATSWSGFFAGANSTQVKNALKEMKEFAHGQGELSVTDQVARPFPDRFDLRSARVRAYLLWELRAFADRLGIDGEPLDVIGLIARSDASAFRHIVSSQPSLTSPANRIILPTEARLSIRSALLKLPVSHRDAVLTSHGVPPRTLTRLAEKDGSGFVEERANYLADLERTFIAEIGIQPATSRSGEADIDTE